MSSLGPCCELEGVTTLSCSAPFHALLIKDHPHWCAHWTVCMNTSYMAQLQAEPVILVQTNDEQNNWSWFLLKTNEGAPTQVVWVDGEGSSLWQGKYSKELKTGTFSGGMAGFGEVCPRLKPAVPPVCNGCRVTQTSGGIWLQEVQLKEHLSPEWEHRHWKLQSNYRKQLPNLQFNKNHKYINDIVNSLQKHVLVDSWGSASSDYNSRVYFGPWNLPDVLEPNCPHQTSKQANLHGHAILSGIKKHS